MKYFLKNKIYFILFTLVFLLSFSKALALIQRVSIDDVGNEGNDSSENVAISGNGRYVAIFSFAENLVANDTNGTGDVFVYDLNTNQIELVSLDNLGNQGTSGSGSASISYDGRYVAFLSGSDNFVAGDTNLSTDVFVYDRDSDTIERVSVDNLGNEGNASSEGVSISGDGRYVAFESQASNLVTDDNNGAKDIFVYDRDSDTIERISVDNSGNEGNGDSGFFGLPAFGSISYDGRYVTFQSQADNLVPDDNNGLRDVFVYDRDTDTIERISVDNSGNEGNGNSQRSSISSDGRYVAFQSTSTNLVPNDTNISNDVFVYDRDLGTIERVSVDDLGNEGNADSASPKISGDGRYVVFHSQATNLVSGDTNGFHDVFVYDRMTKRIKMVSTDDFGVQGDSVSLLPDISDDGERIAFVSNATNLILNDLNGLGDIYVFTKDANNDPTDIFLSPATINENEPAGTSIGTLTTDDNDFGDIYTYSLGCTIAGADDASFSISGTILLSAEVFDYEIKDSYDICISVDDSNGGVLDKNFIVLIIDINESVGGGGSSGGYMPPPSPVFGCTNQVAINYNSSATIDDNSCILLSSPPLVVNNEGGVTESSPQKKGCMDEIALNYDQDASEDNGDCIYDIGEPIALIPIEISETPTSLFESKGIIPSDFDKNSIIDFISKLGIIIPLTLIIISEVISIFGSAGTFSIWNLVPMLALFRKRKKPWGTVYDSVTKQPLDPVYVSLNNNLGQSIQTSITDMDGRYGFLVRIGQYFINTGKANYVFPSKKLSGKNHDSLYDNLYFGESLNISKDDDLIIRNIPMDSTGFSWNEFEKDKNKELMKYYSKREIFFAKLSQIVFGVGFVSSLFITYFFPTNFNFIILGIYVVIFTLITLGLGPKSFGYVFEKNTGYPLSFAIIRVFSESTGKEVSHSVVGKTGRYYILTPKGRYYLKIQKKTGEDSYEDVYSSPPFTSKNGYINKKIKV